MAKGRIVKGTRGARKKRKLARSPSSSISTGAIERVLRTVSDGVQASDCPTCRRARRFLFELDELHTFVKSGSMPAGFRIGSEPSSDDSSDLLYSVGPIDSDDEYEVAYCESCNSYEVEGPFE